MSGELPLGEKLEWSGAELPSPEPLRGTHILLRSVDPALDGEPLYAASHAPTGDPAIWTDRWSAIRGGFEAWLAAENFDASGRQRRSLTSMIEQSVDK